MSRRARRPAPAPTPAAASWPDWPFALAVFLLTAVVYLPALANGFVSWDDGTAIVRNANLQGLDAATVRWAFTTLHMGHYQPLAWLSLALDRELWGLDAKGFHASALLLHALNALLVYRLARRLFALSGGPAASGPAPAALAALLFSLHPLRVESVAWAVERRDLLSAAFFFAAVLAYLRAHAASTAATRRRLWLAAALAASVFAVLAKAIAPMLLGSLLLLDFWPLRRIGPRTGDIPREGRWRPWIEKLPWAILAAASAVVAVLGQQASGSLYDVERYGAPARAVAVVRSLAFYPLATVWPAGLAPLYELPLGGLRIDLRFAAALALVGGATLFAFAAVRRRPVFAVTWGWYLVHLLPLSGIVQIGPQWAADRYSYLACLGFALLAAGLLAAAIGRARSAAARRALVAVACLVVVALAWGTRRQIAVWHDSLSLWNATIERQPGASIAYSNRGAEWVLRGDWQRAEADLREALRLYPPYSDAWLNLAYVTAQQGDWRESAEAARQALALRPGDPLALARLGTAQLKLGDLVGALASYDRLIEVAPRDGEARLRRASLLDMAGRSAEALGEARRAVELDPSRALPRVFLATLLEKQGNLAGARREAEAALAFEPASRPAREFLEHLERPVGAPAGRPD